VASVVTADGHTEIIEHDAQTNFDNAQLSEPVSQAPGSTNVGSRGFDVNLDINYQALNFQAMFQDRDNIGTGQGVGNALYPDGKAGGERLLLSIDYHRTFNPQWFADVKLSHHRSSQWIEETVLIFPKGAFFGAFKDGLSGNPGWGETNEIIQTRLIYSGNEIQKITFGGGYRKEELYRVTETKNFDATFDPLDALIDMTDTLDIFLPETKRNNYFAYVQDEYQLAADCELTLGIRYDDYSDFGATTNTAQNIGKVKGFGVEMELSYQASPYINLLVNYAYQVTTSKTTDKTVDKTTNDDLGGAPTRQLYAKVNWQLSESIHFNSQIKYVGKVPRNTFDPRALVGAYTNVAMALRFNALFSGFDLHIKADNLFDEDIRHPSDSPPAGQLVAIPNDLPQAGRALYFGLSRSF
jgi:outer membrane receptor protein involved in Fe transport